MSLNYDLTAVPKTVWSEDDGGYWGVTQSIIYATMGVGIGVIDDSTVEEFVARTLFCQRLYGALCVAEVDGEWVDRPLTREDIEAHKGLKTNVFPMETRASWVKRVVTNSREIFPHPEPKRKR